MDRSFTGLEKRKTYRSLLILVKAMEGRLLTVDLRNETSVSGKVDQVDGCMNVTLSDAAYVERPGDYKYFSTLFVPCRMIRDIVIPNDIRIEDAIKMLLPSKRVPKPPTKKPMTLKRRRMLKQQQATMKLIKEKTKPSTSVSFKSNETQ